MVMRCNRCGIEVSEDTRYSHSNEILCDDCYVSARKTIEVCDPMAVRLAARIRKRMGLKGPEGLTELQKAIYDFIQREGKVTLKQVMEKFNISLHDLETEFTVLRHCELVKGFKEDNKHYLVPFAYK